MEEFSTFVNQGLVQFFEIPGIALVVALAILGVAICIILWTRWTRFAPLRDALNSRIAELNFVDSAGTAEDAQQEFAARFENVSTAMLAAGRKTKELRHAWTQFSETIIDPTDRTLRATARPDGYFLHIGDDIRVLNWWANIFVAIGLVFTFLGIVAALSKATETMGGSAADMAAMQTALTELLTIAAAKFWTSIAGVGASILLRIFDRRWRQSTRHQLEVVCEKLEHGTLFSPAQRLAAEHLAESREQTVALKTFSHELAIAIGEQFEQRVQPMVAVLGSIQTTIDKVATGGFEQIGKGLQEALSANAGKEMEGLSAALTQMTHGLSGIHERLAGSGDTANRQIEDAARQFSVASADMTAAFATMNSRIEVMADRLAQQADEAASQTAQRMADAQAGYTSAAEENGRVLREIGVEMRRGSAETTDAMVSAVRDAVASASAESGAASRTALEQFSGATEGIKDAFDAMDKRIREMGDTLAGTAENAAARNADVLAGAAQALEQAASKGAVEMSGAVSGAVATAAKASGDAMTEALAKFSARFEAAGAGLVSHLAATAKQFEAISVSLQRSTNATSEHAARVTEAAESARGVAVMLDRAATDVQGATVPIREATATISNSIVNARELMARQNEAAQANREAIEAASRQFEGTATAATKAWNDYRTRFEDVDRSLAATLDRIKDASAEHATHLNGHVGRLDAALAEAVDRLSLALEPLQDMASSVEDMLGRLKSQGGLDS